MENQEIHWREIVLAPGTVFGDWTVIKKVARTNTSYAHTMYACRCICGAVKAINSANLRRGLTKSCGCGMPKRLSDDRKRHGHKTRSGPTRTYCTWNSMMARCYYSDSPGYDYYGGRGIKVCKKWHLFDNFLADMGERPLNTSIDRINGERGYSKANCRWATRTMQARNNASCKLNLAAARKIKRLLHKGVATNIIARRFSVCTATVRGIGHGYTWKDA